MKNVLIENWIAEFKNMEVPYKIERYTAELSAKLYFENYVDEPRFLEYCKACYHYGKVWSCPPYAFSVADFWKRFDRIKIVGAKIIFDPETVAKEYTKKEVKEITNRAVRHEKDALSAEMAEEERKHPGSVSLSAGQCSLCGRDNCTKLSGQPCRLPEQMRYSIESLGGDVEKTVRALFGIKLLWAGETRLPAYFTMVGALLYNP